MTDWNTYYTRLLLLARVQAKRPDATEMDGKVYRHVLERKAVFHHTMRSKRKIRLQLLMRQAMPEAQVLEAKAAELLLQ